MDISLDGVDELVADLERAVKLHPDAAEKGLRRSAFRFKAFLAKIVKSKVKEHTGNLTKGFWVSPVKGFRMDMEVDFSAETKKKNPHFHLIENGHDIILPLRRNGVKRKRGGEKVGYKPGIKVLPGARKSFEPKLEEDLAKVRDQILKEAGLL